MLNNPEKNLLQGSEVLKPLFSQPGFVFAKLNKGTGSGGAFASAEFRKADRKFEFHFRFSLGLVTYQLGSESMSHEEYMCSVLGGPNRSRYPGFSKDPLDAFRDLRDDLQDYCAEFLEGTDEAFLRRIEDARACRASRAKLRVSSTSLSHFSPAFLYIYLHPEAA
jgi:hypothetical protein